MDMQRVSGILLHPASIPGPAGMGDLGPSTHDFLRSLAQAGQRLWQILPLGPTGYGDSPYAPFSSFAGNELLVSLELLAAEGLLGAAEIRNPGFPEDRIDYGAVIAWKRPLLEAAAAAFMRVAAPFRKVALQGFLAREAFWLEDYALFRAIKDGYDAKAAMEGRDGAMWNSYWPKELVLRGSAALEAERQRRSAAIMTYKILQFFFAEQWKATKTVAKGLGISIVGDLPIFVAADSADLWSHPELFVLDADRRLVEVAGVPPDYFAKDGQLWGNPLYDWEANRKEGYAWWISRIEAGLRRHDILRIDHFRGFEAYFAVPAGARDARGGTWRSGPGRELFDALVRAHSGEGAAASLPIIAEDLGFITAGVRELRDGLGFPGMRILQFAFDAHESSVAFDPGNGFLPHNYPEHAVVYTGTHDNNTVRGWWEGASREERDYTRRYMGVSVDERSQVGPDASRIMPSTHPVSEAFIREAMKSVASWAVIPMQDILGLGSEARINTPSTLGGNWTWRMAPGSFDGVRAAELREMTRLYGRLRA